MAIAELTLLNVDEALQDSQRRFCYKEAVFPAVLVFYNAGMATVSTRTRYYGVRVEYVDE